MGGFPAKNDLEFAELHEVRTKYRMVFVTRSLYSEVGAVILLLREKLNYSRERLSQLASLPEVVLWQIEVGEREPSLSELGRLAEWLPYTVTELVEHGEQISRPLCMLDESLRDRLRADPLLYPAIEAGTRKRKAADEAAKQAASPEQSGRPRRARARKLPRRQSSKHPHDPSPRKSGGQVPKG